MVKKCLIEGCDGLAGPRTETCPNCRSMFSRWKKRPGGDILAYQGRLRKWQDRILYMGAGEKKYAKVIKVIPKR
jgi:hypothetical protein